MVNFKCQPDIWSNIILCVTGCFWMKFTFKLIDCVDCLLSSWWELSSQLKASAEIRENSSSLTAFKLEHWLFLAFKFELKILALPESQTYLPQNLNYTIGFLGSPACQFIQQILGHISLHNRMCQILIISILIAYWFSFSCKPQQRQMIETDIQIYRQIDIQIDSHTCINIHIQFVD